MQIALPEFHCMAARGDAKRVSRAGFGQPLYKSPVGTKERSFRAASHPQHVDLVDRFGVGENDIHIDTAPCRAVGDLPLS